MVKQIKQLGVLLLSSIILTLGWSASSWAQTTDTITSTGTWTAPAGVVSVQVECWGGGGAGGAGNTNNSGGGGGGGGGEYSIKTSMAVTPSTGYTVTIGAGGVGNNTGDGPAGGQSSFVADASDTVSANGGAGGADASNAGGIGGTGGTSDTSHAGGAGADGTAGGGQPGGGGGGGAGDANVGGAGSGTTAGAGGTTGGGAGGAGGAAGSNGTIGNIPGGGGGGGGEKSGGSEFGGSGARGECKITYTANNRPTGSFNSAAQKDDGSGDVDISIEVDDPDDDAARAQIAYEADNTCDSFSDLTLDEAAGSTADFGSAPDVENDNMYQVGDVTSIITSSGSNTVLFVWSSATDQGAGNTTMCLQLTANDESEDQTTPDTQTVLIDNVNPTAPGDLTLNTKDAGSVTLDFGSSSTDTNEPTSNAYRIFYKAGTTGVTESDTERDSTDLDGYDYNSATSITITGLVASTDYVFNIWSYDQFCQTNVASCTQNKNNATEITVQTDAAAATIDISGTCKQEDQSTNCTDTGTVRVAVNGSLQAETQTTVAGTWTISSVSTPTAGDVITVFIDGANEANEAVAVTKYTGGNITGVDLYENHLAIGSDTNQTIDNADLELYDYTSSGGDEDIWHEVDASNDLTVTGTNHLDAEIIIKTGNTFRPDSTSSGDVYTHDIENNGTVTSDSNIFFIDGSWDNNSDFNADTSTITFIATATTESIDSTGASDADFYNIKVDDSSNTGTYLLESDLDVSGTLMIVSGTLDVQSGSNYAVSVASHWINSGSFLARQGTVTFNATTGSPTITSGSSPFYNIDINDAISGITFTLESSLDVDGTLRILGGSLDTKSGSNYDINVGGHWSNSDIFIPRTGTVTFDATSGSPTITQGSTSFYNIEIDDAGNNVTVTLESQLDVDGALSITDGSLDVKSGSNFAIDVAGNWINNDTFTARSGTVTFISSNEQTVSAGSSNFSNIETENSSVGGVTFDEAWTTTNFTNMLASSTIKFQQSTIFTISGSLNLVGTRDNEIVLDSVNGSGRFTLDMTGGNNTVNFVDVSNSNASTNDILALTSITGGNTDIGEATPHWVIPFSMIPDTPDGSTNSYTSSGANFYTEIGDYPGTPEYIETSDDDVSYVQSAVRTTGEMYVNLSPTPADFGSATSVEIHARHREAGGGDDDCTVYYQIFETEGGTAITTETTGQLLGTTYTDFSESVTPGAQDKMAWDAALLRIRNVYAQNSGPDDAPCRVTAVEVRIQYAAPAVDISGTCQQADQSTNCTDTGTVRVAVDGSLQAETQTTVGGTWTISGVSSPSASAVITTYIESAADEREAVGVTIYDGSGNITGINLYEGKLSIGSDDTPATVSNTTLSDFDNTVSGLEDIFHDVSGNDLTVDTTGLIGNEELIIKSGWTYQPGGNVNTREIENNGTITAESNIFTLEGSFTNASGATFTAGTSTIIFNGSVDQIVTSNGDPFYNIELNNTGTPPDDDIVLADALDINGTMTITNGDLDANTNDILINAASHWVVGALGSMDMGTSTVEFDSTSANQNLTSNGQSFGNLRVNNSAAADGDDNIILLDALVTTGTIQVSDGELDANTNDVQVTVGGFWDMELANAFDAGTSSVTFNASSGTVDIDTGGITNAFTNVEFNDGGGGAIFDYVANAMNVSGTFHLINGTFIHTVASDITISGTMILNSGVTFTDSSAASIVFDGAPTIYADNTSPSQNIGDVSLSSGDLTLNSDIALANLDFSAGTDDLTTNGYSLDVNGNVTLDGNIDATDGAGGMSNIAVSGNWNATGGTFTAGSSTIEFDSAAANQTFTTAGLTYHNIEINNTEGTGSDNITISGNLDMTGSMIITDGDLDANTNDPLINLEGNWFVDTLGSMDMGTSTVEFDSTSANQNLTSNGQSFGNLRVNNSAAADGDDNIILLDALVTTGTIQVSDGELDANTNDVQVTVGGFWDMELANAFDAGTSSVTFNASSGTVDIDTGGTTNAFTNVEFNDGGGGAIFDYVANAMNVSGTFHLINGTFIHTVASDITISGTMILNSGVTFTDSSAASIVFDGAPTIYADNTSPSQNIGDVSLSSGDLTLNSDIALANLDFSAGTDDLTTNGYSLDVNGNVTLDGNIDATDGAGGMSNIAVSGNWNATGGTFTAGSSTIEFDSAAANQTFTTAGLTYHNIEINNTEGTGSDNITISGNLDMTGSMIITDGDLDANTNDPLINLEGNWFVDTLGSMDMTSSTVTFDAASGTSTITLDADSFYNLVVDDADGGADYTVILASDIGVDGTLSIVDGTFDLDGYDVIVGGNVDIDDTIDLSSGTDGNATVYTAGTWDATGGTFTATDSTVIFDGSNGSFIVNSSGGTFNNLTFNDGGNPATYSLQSDLVITGTLQILGGTVDLDGYELTLGGTMDIGDTLDASTGTDGNSTITVPGGWDMSSGVFTNTNSTVLFTGTSDNNQFDIFTGSNSFYSVNFNDNGGGTTWEIQDNFAVDGTFALTDGIFDTNAANDYQVNVIGTFQVNNGSFNANASTIIAHNDFYIADTAGIFNAGTSTVSLVGSGFVENADLTNNMYRLIAAATGEITTLSADVNTSYINFGTGTITGTTAGLDLSIGVSLDGVKALTNDGVTSDNSGGDYITTFRFNTTGSISIDGGTYTDIGLLYLAAADVHLDTRALTIDNFDTLTTAGSFSTNDYVLNATTIDLGSGASTFNAGGSTITVTNTGTQTGVRLDDSTNILNLQTSNWTILGEWQNFGAGTVNPGTSSVTFAVPSGTTDIHPAGQSFYDLAFYDSNGGGPVTYELEEALTVLGSLTIDSGILDVNAAENNQINVGANWIINGGTFTAQSGTVTFTSTVNNQSITSSGESFNDVVINPSSTLIVTTQDAMVTTGSLVVTTGTFDANDQSVTINEDLRIQGGGFLTGTGAVIFGDAVGDAVVITSGTIVFESDAIDTDITINAGTVTNSGGAIVYRSDGSTTTFSSLSPYNNLLIDSSGNTFTGNTDLDVNGYFNLTDGIFSQGANNDLNVGGNFTIASGTTFTKATGTGTLTFDGNLTLTDNTSSDLGLVVTGASSSTTTLATDVTAVTVTVDSTGAFDVDGYDVTLSGTVKIDGTFDASTGTDGNVTIDVGGGWDMTTGVFTNTNSTVLFTGTSDNNTFYIFSNSKSFYNVNFNDNGGGTTWEIEDNIGVDGTFALTDGIFDTNSSENNQVNVIGTFQINNGDFNANASTIIVHNDFEIASISGLFNRGTSTVQLAGTGNLTNGSTGNGFYNLLQNNGIATTMTTLFDVQNIFTTGDGTSSMTGTSGGLRIRFFETAELINNGVVWSNLTFRYEAAELPAGDYGDITINAARVSNNTVLTGNISGTTTFNVTGAFGGSVGNFDTDGFNMTVDTLSIGGTNSNRSGTMFADNSTITVLSDVLIRDADTGESNNLYGESATFFVAGDWTVESVANLTGTFAAGTSTVRFNGASGTSTITVTGTTTTNDFYNLVIDDQNGGGDYTVTTVTPLAIDGTLHVADGTFDLDGYDITVGGTLDLDDTLDASAGTGGNATIIVGRGWDATSGTFTSTDSTVMFTSTFDDGITAATQPFNNLIINDGLIGYWKLDESSSPAVDSSGYGNDGTWVGAVTNSTNTTGTINFANSGSADFPGVNGSYVDLGTMDIEGGNGGLTLAAWIYSDDLNPASCGSTDCRIVSKGTSSAENDHWWMLSTIDSGGNARLRFRLKTDLATDTVIATSGDLIINTWYHVAAVYTGSTAELYLNGGLVGSGGTFSGLVAVDDTIAAAIGCLPTVNTDCWEGEIDEVRIYNRALSSTEIEALANGTTPASAIGTYTLQDNLDVNGTLTINAGTFDVGSDREITVGGSWLNHGGVFSEQTGSVMFDATSGTVAILEMQTFYNVEFGSGGAGATFEIQGSLDINGTFLLTNGAFDLATHNVHSFIEGNFTLNGGTFTPPVATITWDGVKTFTDNIVTNIGTIHITPDTLMNTDMTCTSLTVAVNDTLTTDGYEIDCSKDITIDGTLDARSGTDGFTTINIGEDWNSGAGLLFMHDSTVVFDDTAGNSSVTLGAGNSFYNVTFADGNGGGNVSWNMQDDLDVEGTLTIVEGELDATTSNFDIYVAGGWLNQDDFDPRSGTVIFDGTGEQVVETCDGCTTGDFNNIVVTNGSSSTVFFLDAFTVANFTAETADTNLNFEASRTVTITGSLVLNGQATGSRIFLNSSDFTNRFEIDNMIGALEVDYVNVSNSEVSTNSITANNSIDNTNTDSGEGGARWIFSGAVSGPLKGAIMIVD